MSAERYEVGAHFKALIKAILVQPLKSFERFFCISSSPARLCLHSKGNTLLNLNFLPFSSETNGSHSPAGELEMQKNLSMVVMGAIIMPSMRAAK